VDGGLHLHTENVAGILDSDIVSAYAERPGHIHADAGCKHHEIEFGPFSSLAGILEFAARQSIRCAPHRLNLFPLPKKIAA